MRYDSRATVVAHIRQGAETVKHVALSIILNALSRAHRTTVGAISPCASIPHDANHALQGIANNRSVNAIAIGTACCALAIAGYAQEATTPTDASSAMHAEWHGLWIAERRFVAQLNGPVTIYPLGERWIAQVQGERVAAERTVADDGNIHWSFAVLNLGRFEGHQLDALSPINGHWIQPAGPVYYNRFATPVRLTRTAHGAFDGMLQPVEERYSLSIPMIATEASGSTTRYRTFLRNPDRNTGIYFPIETAAIVDDQEKDRDDNDDPRTPVAFSRDRIEAFHRFDTENTGKSTYERLLECIAPAIYGHQDVKKGVLCMLFGGGARSR